ncbi:MULTISPECIES: TIGR03364 family FAD-dependent oxidoreductase [unclassified Lysobacter]|uniref:TIGR03364 family FAD-dependent oxidoreductase n=1 Tax=unclassified Lysobacter TaxID=2635362 RepID=UPI001BEAECA6|nr:MULTISPECIES: TIGR03364 family FAD-dependent oxidoreductase [unclassified Lysobacter]MBT2749335.1 TIGR03364 family FAD-dependent oxidoreductase [Lysobacter sp. ISL-42]MBT2750890.1 TIGR03364 family FAD-dependent oxidoreductase [Lysobacter sp. ISL-50]MBT2777957.1 TIGR03364 family FAD-dependent oxidoreductase [Lysobacter sp. ISL-54]MBT2783985.1 TIGR03364 family FAD-dependent oxidoreductase [Lysobacter sp. ISL-52]
MKSESALVIGAGIVGLAIARALAVRGHRVTVLERYDRAVGASVRNFGMIWPIGVTNGAAYERALRSRAIWQEVIDGAGLWHDPCGSLHMAYEQDEWEVLEQYAAANRSLRPCSLLDRDAALAISPVLVGENLRGALFNRDEMIVDPRQALAALPGYLHERHGVEFHWRTPVTAVESGRAHSGTRRFEADRVFVCSGPDFEQLYPQVYAAAPLTRCKLQMMRLAAQPDGFRLGSALCGGLSLVHYAGFQQAADVAPLRARYQEQFGELIELGIHVMAAQNGRGEVTIGDSHAYAHTHDPFDEQSINAKVLDYLNRFLRLPDPRVIQTWHGIYPKLTDGSSEFVAEPAPGVTIVNAVGGGGLGMTLSFGLAEEIVDGRYGAVRRAAA